MKLRFLSAALLLVACGEPEPPSSAPPAPPRPAVDEPQSAGPEASEPGAADPLASSAAERAPNEHEAPALAALTTSEPIDLLRATRASLAVSSAYRDDVAQVHALVDGDLETAWNSRTGELEGAWIEARVPDDASVTSIALTAGFTRRTARADLFEGNHRVARVRVLREGAELGVFPVDPSSREIQSLPVSGPGGRYRIELVELVPGSRADWREACISELRVLGHAPGAIAASASPTVAIGALPEAPTSAAAPVDPRGGDADGMYFLLSGGGLVRLGPEGRFETVSDYGTALSRSPDGALYLLRSSNTDGHRIERIGGGEPALIPVDRGLGWTVQGLAMLDEGRAWVVGLDKVGYWDGSRWSITSIPRTVSDVHVDEQGIVWVLASSGVHRRADDGRFERSTPASAGAMLNGRLMASPRGLVAPAADGRIIFADGEWRPLTARDGSRVQGPAALLADGTLVARASPSAIMIQPPAGDMRTLDLVALGVTPSAIWAFGGDADGRLYVSTTAGLVVIEPDHATLARWYQRGSIPALEHDIIGMHSLGAAPLLPPSRPAARVRGRFTRAGEPLGNARVQLCTSAFAELRGRTLEEPCDRTSYDLDVETAEDGTFWLWQVPREDLVLSVHLPGGRYWVTTTSRCCSGLQTGQELDIGTFDVPAQ